MHDVYLMNVEHDSSVKRMKFPSTYDDVSYFTQKHSELVTRGNV